MSTAFSVYCVFNSLDEFKEKTVAPLFELSQQLVLPIDDASDEPVPGNPSGDDPTSIPKPLSFYAEPDYIGSHQFVGRASELEDLSDWAKPADPTNLLLYEAIGGNGKRMLTWEWTTTTPRRSVTTGPGGSGIRSMSGAPSWRTSRPYLGWLRHLSAV